MMSKTKRKRSSKLPLTAQMPVNVFVAFLATFAVCYPTSKFSSEPSSQCEHLRASSRRLRAQLRARAAPHHHRAAKLIHRPAKLTIHHGKSGLAQC